MWPFKKQTPTNPNLLNTATPTQLADMEARVDAEHKTLREAQRRSEELADKNICPSCAHYPTKDNGFHELSGTAFYKCPACGWRGNGKDCF